MFMAQNLRKMCRLVNFDEMFHLFLMLWAESLEALQDSLCGFMLFPFWHLHRLLPPIQWGSTICTVVGVSYMLSAEPELSILPRRLSTFFLNICSLIFWVKDSHMKETLRFGVPEETLIWFRIPALGASTTCHVSKGQCILQVQQRAIFTNRGEFIFWKNWMLWFWSSQSVPPFLVLLSEVTMFIKYHKKYWLILMLSISPYGQPAAGSGRLASCTLLRS